MSRAKMMKVYGRSSASFTIHTLGGPLSGDAPNDHRKNRSILNGFIPARNDGALFR
jgi:hypothetical protein